MRTDAPATWFRMYAEFANDPKVQMLSEVNQRRFLMLLCLRCGNGSVTLHDTEIAFQLRISDEEWAATKKILCDKGLIDNENKPTKWETRQFDSDTSNARVAKHRALRKEKQQVQCNADVTLPKRKSNALETETETETEKNTERVSKQPTARGTRLPKDFEPDFQFAVDAGIPNTLEEAHKFRDYWNSQPGQKGVKSDWPATWRNWCRNTRPAKPQARASPPAESFRDTDARKGMERWQEMTGRQHPDLPQHRTLTDITPPLELQS